MREGTAHRVPLIIGNNAEEGRLFTRWLKLLPTNESMIETPAGRHRPGPAGRITAAYPGYPDAAACIQLGGDFAFGSAAWQIAEAHSMHAPTYLYRYDYAPRTLNWTGLGATHATELFAVFDIYRTRFGVAAHRGGGREVRTAGQRRRANPLAGVQPYRRARRRLACLHPLRPCGHGVRPPAPGRARPARRPSAGVGGLFGGGTLGTIAGLLNAARTSPLDRRPAPELAARSRPM